MIAVWSLWSKPYTAFSGSAWKKEKYNFLAWILSVETARKHYPYTKLVCDEEGAKLLVDILGIDFTEVDSSLKVIDHLHPEWWAMGKLWAYKSQKEPFVHIDNDVFLWNGLPDWLVSAPVFAQNPEHFNLDGDGWYRVDKFDRLKEANGWVPDEIAWFKETGNSQRAECCGIFGGNDLAFIKQYAETGLRVVDHPANRQFWDQTGGDNILVEQYLLSACIEYHRHVTRKEPAAFDINYLFSSATDAFNPDWARMRGYTHMIGGAKRNDRLLKRLEARVACDYPEQYRRCMEYVTSRGLSA